MEKDDICLKDDKMFLGNEKGEKEEKRLTDRPGWSLVLISSQDLNFRVLRLHLPCSA